MDPTIRMACVALLFSMAAAVKFETSNNLEVEAAPIALPTAGQAFSVTSILLFVVASVLWSMQQGKVEESGKEKEKDKLVKKDPALQAIAQQQAHEAVQQAGIGMGDWKCCACACALGTLNNNAYSTVVGASQNLAKQFAMQDYMSLFSTTLLVACLSGVTFNSAICLKIGVHTRILVIVIFIVTGYMMLSIASSMAGSLGFMTALLASCLVGTAQTLGEIGLLSFFRPFPSCILGAWGAGTGLAGISGGSLYVFLLSLNLTNTQIFAYMVPTAGIYYGCFIYLYHRAQKCGALDTKGSASEKNAQLSMESFKEVAKYTWVILVNMAAVYALEYTIYPGLVDRDTLCPVSKGFVALNAYTLMWTMYNVGVTLSRLSISWFRIDNLWIITGLQALNVALWFVEAMQHNILNTFGEKGYYILFVWMIWIGLMGGACYSNCMYAFNNREGIPNEYRELGVNIGMIMCNLGVLCATNFTTVLQTTIMSSNKLFPHGCPVPKF